MGEGILRDAIARAHLNIEVDSAGTQGYHTGEAPDRRAIQCMREHDLDISHQRARKLTRDDFEHFDLILTMDQSNYVNARAVAPNDELRQKVQPMMSAINQIGEAEVPDPYYGGRADFEIVFDMCQKAAEAWCNRWKAE
jgi:protein-tyrosine phosphatase